MKHEPLRIDGIFNFVLLGGIVAAIFCSGQYDWRYGVQESVMLAIAVVAYMATPRTNRAANKFTFGPIIEVAVLFLGIFVTMAPALLILNAWGAGLRHDLGQFGMHKPWEFFWASGALSSFLDNAPTYLTFAATAAGLENVTILETAGAPAVYGDWLHAGPDAPTVLVYGHHDVQPVDPLGQWTSPPFEPVIVDGECRARGAIDDKGQVLYEIEAVRGLLERDGRLPVNRPVRPPFVSAMRISTRSCGSFTGSVRRRTASSS